MTTWRHDYHREMAWGRPAFRSSPLWRRLWYALVNPPTYTYWLGWGWWWLHWWPRVVIALVCWPGVRWVVRPMARWYLGKTGRINK